MSEELRVHVVSHTHWDREWYLTREQFRLRLMDLVDRVLDLLESEPRFTAFHLDGQTIVLEDYLEVRPEQEPRLRRQIAEGRLLVGPWYVMPDEFLVSGEALVRNLALGHRIAEGFGAVMAVGYVPDPFGHVAQLPQVLAGFGLDAAVLWRGFGGPKAEYLWEAPDGTRILLCHLPTEGYCNALRLPFDASRLRERAEALVARERARTTVGEALFMAGVDHVEPHPSLLATIDALNEVPGVSARLSTLPAYVAAVRAPGAPLEVVHGELRGGQEHAFLLPGVLSTRTYLKQANARVQRSLEQGAEPLALFAWRTGAPWPSGPLAYAWKTLLQNHPHDSICGCSIDAVHEENMSRFASAEQVAAGLSDRALRFLARAVAAPPEGAVRALVVNTGPRAFTGVVEGVVELPFESIDPREAVDPALLDTRPAWVLREAPLASIVDADGRPVPFQVLADEAVITHLTSRFAPPWAVRARSLRLLLSAEAPACGYAAYDLRFGHAATAHADPFACGERSIENALLRVQANDDGTVDVEDKRTGGVLRRCAELEDVGDAGDEYTFSPPLHDRRVTSADARSLRVSLVERGPLRATLAIEVELPVPLEARPDGRARSEERTPLAASLRVSLQAGSPRADFTLVVDNRARDHRLRVLFPTGAALVETARADTAFGVVERAARAESVAGAREAPVSAAPLQSFVDAGDGERGVTLLSDGLMEYAVVPGDEARLALTLLRCVGALSRGDLATRQGHAGPGLATPGGQCPGRHTFRFAVLPRSAPPPASDLFEEARRLLSPPLVVMPAGGEGRLPLRHAFLSLEGDPVVLSACKRADDRDSIVLRLFNPEGREARATVSLPGGTGAAWRLDLRERRLSELPVEGGRAVLAIGPHRIETVEVPTV